jgi:hypothetical protein
MKQREQLTVPRRSYALWSFESPLSAALGRLVSICVFES